MPARINLIGQPFTRLVVLELSEHQDRRGVRKWKCRCVCGNIVFATTNQLRSKGSCGCLRHESYALGTARTHGLSRHPLRPTHNDMMRRCYDPSSPDFHNYGGRNIKVHGPWHDLRNFIRDIPPRPLGHQLNRVNNDGDYEPGNVVWSDLFAQNRNRRDNHWITFNEKKMVLTDWAKELKVWPTTLLRRLKNGWTLERALTTPGRGMGSLHAILETPVHATPLPERLPGS